MRDIKDSGMEEGDEIMATDAAGGGGEQAVVVITTSGCRPVASTGSPHESTWLMERGAVRVIGRDEVADSPGRVLASETWAGAIDCVGGDTLAQIIRSLRYGAAVAASGLVASAELATTVYPFITRSVALLGIDSVEATTTTRARVWSALGALAASIDFESLIDREVDLDDLPSALGEILAGKTRGRVLVTPNPG
jgi:acrylyl-CoA reductase (NADPH)